MEALVVAVATVVRGNNSKIAAVRWLWQHDSEISLWCGVWWQAKSSKWQQWQQ